MLSGETSAPRRLCASPGHGLSLIEVVVVLALLGIAAAAVGRLGATQGAHFRDVAARTHARSGLREGAAVLAAELRGISPAGDLDSADMRNASIAFRSTIGTYLLCETAAQGALAIDVMDIAGLGAGSSSGDERDVTAIAPSAGDSLLLYHFGADPGNDDDVWTPLLVVGATRVERSCMPPTEPRRPAYRLRLSATLDATVEPHAPLRAFRRVRYALYRASDGLWYLGFSDCRPVVRTPACTALQPVSGPYEPASVPGARRPSGLTFAYLDGDERPTSEPTRVASIALSFRARANDATRLAWSAVERHSVALRNARP